MWVRPSGKSIDTREVQPKKPQSAIEVTPLGTTTWPCASGVYKQTAAAPPSASSSKVVGRISCQLRIGRTVSAIGRAHAVDQCMDDGTTKSQTDAAPFWRTTSRGDKIGTLWQA